MDTPPSLVQSPRLPTVSLGGSVTHRGLPGAGLLSTSAEAQNWSIAAASEPTRGHRPLGLTAMPPRADVV